MHREELARLLDAWLEPERFKDVAENGLQVEGRQHVKRIVCGVSASLALIEKAIELSADAIVVHHGLVWGGGMRRLEGWLGQRVRKLMRADISLFAYHLPLDAQSTFGNNAGLATVLGIDDRAPFAEYKGQMIGVQGRLSRPATLREVAGLVTTKIGNPLAVFGDPNKMIERVGVCSGGAPESLHEAIAAKLDLYLTGEVTEWVRAVSLESGVAFIAGGHHQTERFGPRGLADALSKHGFDARFVDDENPA
jgi:dinuclear metal center YbgI/SA1388 family protein